MTDSTWKGADSPIIFSEIYDGETYDARLELDGWNTSEFDDSAWHPVQTVDVGKCILTPQAGCKVAQMTSIPAKRIFKTPQGVVTERFCMI